MTRNFSSATEPLIPMAVDKLTDYSIAIYLVKIFETDCGNKSFENGKQIKNKMPL